MKNFSAVDKVIGQSALKGIPLSPVVSVSRGLEGAIEDDNYAHLGLSIIGEGGLVAALDIAGASLTVGAGVGYADPDEGESGLADGTVQEGRLDGVKVGVRRGPSREGSAGRAEDDVLDVIFSKFCIGK